MIFWSSTMTIDTLHQSDITPTQYLVTKLYIFFKFVIGITPSDAWSLPLLGIAYSFPNLRFSGLSLFHPSVITLLISVVKSTIIDVCSPISSTYLSRTVVLTARLPGSPRINFLWRQYPMIDLFFYSALTFTGIDHYAQLFCFMYCFCNIIVWPLVTDNSIKGQLRVASLYWKHKQKSG